MAVLENFDPQKFINNLVRIYCKQNDLEVAEWKFVEEDKKEQKETAKEVETIK